MRKNCILCQTIQTVLYGDVTYGECFCKECFDIYSCFHCKKMNLQIVFNKRKEQNQQQDQEMDQQHDQEKDQEEVQEEVQNQDNISNINYLPLYGHKFKLFCESCYKNEDVYNIEDDLSVNNDEEMDEYDSEFEYDIDDEDEYNAHTDMYYVRRGKYDLY